MRHLVLLSFLFISLASNAASYYSLVLKDNTVARGEVIEIYKDRWFYEAPTKDTPTFVLLFERINNKPVFHFKNIKEIRKVRFLKTDTSQYEEYLKENNLVFQNHLVKDAHVLTGNEGHHKFEKMFGNFAWDIGILDETGSQFQNEGNHLEDYYIFNREITSPISGTVVGRISNQEDNVPDLTFTSDLSSKINNYLTIHIKDQIYLSIVHFKKDTITVEVGDKVEVGQSLGTVGNSGVSYLPHLHYTLYLYVKEFDRFISVPGLFHSDL